MLFFCCSARFAGTRSFSDLSTTLRWPSSWKVASALLTAQGLLLPPPVRQFLFHSCFVVLVEDHVVNYWLAKCCLFWERKICFFLCVVVVVMEKSYGELCFERLWENFVFFVHCVILFLWGFLSSFIIQFFDEVFSPPTFFFAKREASLRTHG